MAEKELRKMNRTELIEIIYALQQNEKNLRAENEELHQQIEDKLLRIENAGSIAEAALSLNHIFDDAQRAAQQYLDSIQAAEDKAGQIVAEAQKQADETVFIAQRRADAANEQARKTEEESAALAERTKSECSALREQTEQYVKQQRNNLLEETETLFKKYTELAKEMKINAVES